MFLPFGRLLPVVAFSLLSLFASAQEISPYSRYGMGDIESSDFAASRGMGGLSSTYRNPLQINYANPASYSAISLSTLEVGFNFNTKIMNTSSASYSTGDGFLDYFALAIPVGRKAGISFGLIPFTKMNYSFADSTTDPSAGTYGRIFNGSGRTYKVYFGGAYRVLGNDTSMHLLSLGANFNVLFGYMNYSESINFPDSLYALSTQKIASNHITNFIFDIGVQYLLRLNKHDSTYNSAGIGVRKPDTHMTIGGFVRIPTNLASKLGETFQRYDSVSGYIIDTLTYSTTSRLTQNMPKQAGFGLSFSKGFQWQIGADVTYSTWAGFRDVDNNNGVKYRDDVRVSLGGEIRPKGETGFFLKRTFYRLGAYYDNGYLTVAGQDIKEYGFTFGLGIPMKSESKGGIISVPYLNVYFSYANRGTTAANLISEHIFSGTLAFTLNSKWFIKPQYE